jgi:cell division transport system ATP-binding protein
LYSLIKKVGCIFDTQGVIMNMQTYHSAPDKSSVQGLLLGQLKAAGIGHRESVVLTDVDLDIHEGQFTYLIGVTGSGKSSLLRTLYADLPLCGGEGHIFGFDLKDISFKNVPLIRRQIGIVFQDFQLLADRSVSDNLEFLLRATDWKNKLDIEKRIWKVLNMVGISHLLKKMPHEISGGEQQRVAIARALLNNPKLLIADEPTGNLDPDTALDILELLFKLSKENKMSVIMATHDYRLIEDYPARVLRCAEGKLSK